MTPESTDGTTDSALSRYRTRAGYAVGATVVAVVLVGGLFWAGVLTVPDGTTDAARSLLEQYGLPALFGVFVIEGAMLLYFAPSESLVPAAVLFLADSPGDIAAILAVAVAGATLGQTVLFVAAKRGGRELVRKRRWVAVSDATLDRFASWFDRWGPVAVPVSNTLLFTRGMVTVPAALAEMDTRRFVVLSALGTLSFEGILAAVTVFGADALAGV
jgi:membrane protein DedA with SNARE-associated domain